MYGSGRYSKDFLKTIILTVYYTVVLNSTQKGIKIQTFLSGACSYYLLSIVSPHLGVPKCPCLADPQSTQSAGKEG